MNKTIQELIERKSIRVFLDKPISKNDKELIFKAMVNAPSAGNQQFYTVIDVTEQTIKNKLAKLCDNQPFISKAKMVLVFLADLEKWYDAFLDVNSKPRKVKESDLLLAIVDASVAAENAVTAAHSLGIGSCYIGDIMENEEEIRKLLNIPKYAFPACMLVFGYPTKQQLERNKPIRVDNKYIINENKYHNLTREEREKMFIYKANNRPYEDYMKSFCNFKYNSAFSKEMVRSAKRYLKNFR